MMASSVMSVEAQAAHLAISLDTLIGVAKNHHSRHGLTFPMSLCPMARYYQT